MGLWQPICMTIKARDIEVKVISSKDAARIIKSIHYSGKVVQIGRASCRERV